MSDKKLALIRLYDLIEKTNKMLAKHRSAPEPDNLLIEQLLDLKKRFTKELLSLLKTLELDFQVAA